jgi:hypothetical protein
VPLPIDAKRLDQKGFFWMIDDCIGCFSLQSGRWPGGRSRRVGNTWWQLETRVVASQQLLDDRRQSGTHRAGCPIPTARMGFRFLCIHRKIEEMAKGQLIDTTSTGPLGDAPQPETNA